MNQYTNEFQRRTISRLMDEGVELKRENERLRLLAKRFANAIVTGQRYEGLICQAEDFLKAAADKRSA